MEECEVMLEIQIEFNSSKGISEGRVIDTYDYYPQSFVLLQHKLILLFLLLETGWYVCLNIFLFLGGGGTTNP